MSLNPDLIAGNCTEVNTEYEKSIEAYDSKI